MNAILARGSPLRAAWLFLLLAVCAHGRAAAEPARVGLGPEALPAVYEVPLAVATTRAIGARAGLGYGYTEGVLKVGDSHHRTQLDLAASLTPLPWFAASLRLLGRYDKHVGKPDDGDYGVITESHVSGRADTALGDSFRVGSELNLWLPGAQSVGDAPAALSGDLQLLGTWVPTQSPLSLGLALGLRVDRSKHAGGDPYRYSRSDRLALGASDSALAARLGLGMSYQLGALDLLAEWSWKMYFDYAGSSPMWLRAGARYRPSRLWQFEAMLGLSPSKRPPLDETAPLAVVEPRIAANLAAMFLFPWGASGGDAEAGPEPEPVVTASLQGEVVGASGAGIEGASVSVAAAGGGNAGEPSSAVRTSARGVFSLEGLPAGAYQVKVSAPGWIAHEESLQLAARELRQLRVVLKRELPKGQIRGTVRDFNGQPASATIVIKALDIAQDNGSDGSFEINVPPGDYEVVVKARGRKAQTRRARVEEDGVAILIIELESRSRK